MPGYLDTPLRVLRVLADDVEVVTLSPSATLLVTGGDGVRLTGVPRDR